MSDVPIHLIVVEVALLGPREGEIALRWTLGPQWYESHQYDEGPLPYFDDRVVEYGSTPPQQVMDWAAQQIARTTDYRVTGWNCRVPQLDVERHTIEIWTIGTHASYVATGSAARRAYCNLGDPNAVIVLPCPDGATARIPVRSIAVMNSTVRRYPVVNA